MKTWSQNIGNGFIDLGARTVLQLAAPDAEVVDVSGHSNRVADRLAMNGWADVWRSVRRRANARNPTTNLDSPIRARMLNLASLIDADVAVLAGCVLDDINLRRYLPVLDELRRRGTPLLFLGVGGSNYRANTIEFMTGALERLAPAGFITRDAVAHGHYGALAPESHSGIDCAFFMPDGHQPPRANRPLAVLTFDASKEPEVDLEGAMPVRVTQHPFDSPFLSLPRRVIDKRRFHDRRFFRKSNIFLSDSVADYLFLYANSRVTHSDKVHACIATLAYGNRAQFYWETP
ncbi:MAG TPA: polysaccharide pyruvyl transferase family protein, partial [Longimicrobium sp.]|nr:polysaccharide pyruvyl transferase family protein [Longimicrobium sp.]